MYRSIESRSAAIDRVWTGDSDVEPVGHRSDPVLGADLVFHLVGGTCRVVLQGPVTHRRVYPTCPGSEYVGVRFRPGVRVPYEGASVRELCNDAAPAELLAGVDLVELGDRLLGAPSLEDRGVLVARAASGAGLGRLPRSELVAAALARFSLLPGEPVSAVAAWLGCTERRLQRGFRDHVGITPKHAARLLRVERVQAAIGAAPTLSRVDLAALAVDGGYCDQSHLTAEVGQVLGVTPAALVAERFDGLSS